MTSSASHPAQRNPAILVYSTKMARPAGPASGRHDLSFDDAGIALAWSSVF
jgi:hypothetical protein